MTIDSAAGLLGEGRLSTNAKRPFVGNDGRSYIVNNGKVQLHSNDGLLMYDEWKDLDRDVISVATQRLTGVADLQSRGLVHNLGSIGVTIAQWEESSDMTEASVSMAGVTRGEEDTPAFKQNRVPVPVIHKDYRINIRRLEASRRFGEALDTTAGTIAGRVVAEKSEDLLFAGSPITVEGETIYGYTTHPDRNTVDISTNWDSVATSSNGDIVDEVNAGLQANREDLHFGPFIMYIPTAYESKLDEDFQQGSGDTRTLRQRLLQLSGLEDIKVADRLPANNVVIVSMARETVDLAIAQNITNVQWDERGGMTELFKTMAVWVPRIKSDYDNRSGIAHLRPAP